MWSCNIKHLICWSIEFKQKGFLQVLIEHIFKYSANSTPFLAKKVILNLQLHLRIRHMSKGGLQILTKHNLLLRLKELDLPFYEHCVISKWDRLKFARVATKSKNILYSVHSNVWKSPELSLGGSKYFVSNDDYSRRVWVYPHQKEVKCVSNIQGIQNMSKAWNYEQN